MQSSPSISLERDSSLLTLSQQSSRSSLFRTDKLDKWKRLTRRIVRFFRWINIPSLRSRFIETVRHSPPEQNGTEDSPFYDTSRVPEDFRLMDDIKRYHEMFKTFSSFGFLWQDKEFRLPKLKAHYIYDHYMSTPDNLDQTNIPVDAVFSIYNRLYSPKIVSPLLHFNLFNDVEKFLLENWLRLFLNAGHKCFSGRALPASVPMIHRLGGNQMNMGAGLSVGQSTRERSLSAHSNGKSRNGRNLTPADDDIIIPCWTYSTDLGVVYRPIRERRVKGARKTLRKKTNESNSGVPVPLNTDHSPPEEQVEKPMPARTFPSHRPTRDRRPPVTCFFPADMSKKHPSSLPERRPVRCDHPFFGKKWYSKEIFICKMHSHTLSESPPSLLRNPIPYRIAVPPRTLFRLGSSTAE